MDGRQRDADAVVAGGDGVGTGGKQQGYYAVACSV